MVWAVLIIIVFICVFLLIARIYTTKNRENGNSPQSQGVNENHGEASDSNGDEQ